MKQKHSKFREFKRKVKSKVKKFFNVLLGLALFVVLIGSAFTISFVFGASFVIAFALEIYKGDLKRKPLKPIAIFISALVIRIAMNQYLNPVFQSKTLMDLSVSALIFLSILVFGWRIKKS